MKPTIILLSFLFCGVIAWAQDSSRRKEVNITSAFKPTLKEAAKINFNATPPNTDTSKPRLQYDLPNQNLNFTFQPGSLKPMALQVDSAVNWTNENFLKVGYGNLKTPYIQAGISLGDKNAGININAKHMSSKGKLEMQDYSHTSVDMNAFMKTSKNGEWNVRFGGLQEKYNKYGFTHNVIFHGDSIVTKYQTWGGRLAFHNINLTSQGLNYAPEIKVSVFNDHLNNAEQNLYFNLPLEKMIGETYSVKLAATGQLSHYKQDGKDGMGNNYFTLSPTILFKKPNINIRAGIRPAWDNKEFRLFPNIIAEVYSSGNQFSFQAGWTGDIRNSGFQYLAGFNPWIWAPATVYNTRIEERFAGIKGTLGDHFSYNTRLAYNTIYNQPLYINDTVTGKSFLVVNESKLKVVHLGAELGYTIGEKISVVTNLSINEFSPHDYDKAWGLLPMEWKIDGRLMLMKDLFVNATFYAFDGPWSLPKEGKKNLAAGTDFSAGVEFRVMDNLKIWGQFNNIFNKSYQRWNQYPVYGFNILGGVVFSFAQKN